MMPLIRFTALAAAVLLAGCFEIQPTPTQELIALERETGKPPTAIWPTGTPCDEHEACVAFDHSRRAFEAADPERLIR